MKLDRLLCETHLKVPFNSTIFADPKYKPFRSKLGGDCLDQVFYLYNRCKKVGYAPTIVAFDEPKNPLYHAAVLVDRYFLDPAMGAVKPIIINEKALRMNIAGYGNINLEVSKRNKHFLLRIKSPDGESTRTSSRFINNTRELYFRQINKKVERLSALYVGCAKLGYNDLIKLKQFDNSYWVIYKGESIKKEGKIPDSLLEAFAISAHISVKSFIRVWRLSEKILHEK